MRHWREREFERHLTPATVRSRLGVWGFFAKRPALYRLATRVAIGAMGLAGRRKGRFRLDAARDAAGQRTAICRRRRARRSNRAGGASTRGEPHERPRRNPRTIRRSLGVTGRRDDPHADRRRSAGTRAARGRSHSAAGSGEARLALFKAQAEAALRRP